MTHPPRAATALLVIALLLAACTGADDPEGAGSEDPTPGTAVDAGSDTPGGVSFTTSGIPLAPGAEVDVDPAVLDAAAAWLDEESGLTDMLREEIFLSQATRTRDVWHLMFVQQHGEVSVRGAQFVVHVRDTGEVLGASQSLIETLPGDGATEELTPDEAADVAVKSVPGTVTGDPIVEATWLEVGTQLRLGWNVQVATEDPPSNYSVVVDATTGEVLTVDRLATDHGARRGQSAQVRPVAPAATQVTRRDVAQGAACDAPPPPSACIFVVDPIYASGNTDIDPAQANATLVGVPLANLTDPASGDLVGRYAQIAPQVAAAYRPQNGVYGAGGRGGQDISFEAGMTYYWIDYTQQVVQEMGFDFHAEDPVDFVPIEPAFPDNAFYLFLEDRIHMGIGRDGVNEAEDAQGIIHEYGHALLQAAVPNIVSEEGGAVHEGFADLVSVFTTLEFRNGDIGCLFHWAERGACIRRIDTTLRYPDDLRLEVHLDGEIYTGAVWEVFRRVLERDTGLAPEQCQDRGTNPCDAVRDDVYATLLGSLPFLTPTLGLNDATAAFAASDQVFFAGRNADLITEVFGERGLSASGTPAVQIEGLMDFQPSDSVLSVKIQHAYRGDLALTLQVVDATGQARCGADLLMPDPDDSGDNVQGRFQLEGTDCAAFLPPGPDQVWLLTAVDTLEEDEGTLFQYSISHQGQRFLAPGLPAIIPDADPIGVTAAIGGAQPTGGTTPVQPAPTADSALTVSYDIAHTYVGDLLVQLVVADPATGEIRCRVDLRQPDPQDDGDVLSGVAEVGQCEDFYPPGPSQAWILRVADLAPVDVGEVTSFQLTGPDGVVHEGPVPAAIPDDDQGGVLLPITG
ncbi:MAG TPA: M36 family metallopeptidase [Euzebya sp.]|nr:M36 family metallopeptidase [Euzebya sp.]